MARLIESLATSEPHAEVFSDDCVLQAMLDFESALARAESRVGIVPKSTADHIAAAAQANHFDIQSMSRSMFRAQIAGYAGVPAANTGFPIAQKVLESAELQPSREPKK